jgi:two-component system response regulator DesR
LMAGGLKNKEIAQRLNLSAYTVRNYLSTAYSKLGVTNRTEAVARLRDLGTVSTQEFPDALIAHK